MYFIHYCKLHKIDNTGLHKYVVEIAGYRKTTLFVLSFVSLNVKYKSVPVNPCIQYDLGIPEYGILDLKFGVFLFFKKGLRAVFQS